MVVIIDVGTMKRTRGNSSTGERERGRERGGRYDNEEERMKGRERYCECVCEQLEEMSESERRGS